MYQSANSKIPLRGLKVAFFDWETTWEDEPAEGTIGQHPVSLAVAHADFGVNSSFELKMNQLIKPSVPIRRRATSIHGISDETVKNAPSIDEVIPELMGLVEGRVLVAYNIPFDWKILNERSGGGLEFSGLCGLVMAKVADKKRRGKTLGAVARRRGITFQAHDASADIEATARVMPMLLADIKAMPTFNPSILESVATLWAWTQNEALGWEVNYHNWCKSEGKQMRDMDWHQLLGVERPT
jgi:DNA polymerase III epsilon subunit-like protein